MKEKLLKKIKSRELTVGVIGLGYVGLPLAVEKAKAGFKTIGFDVQKEKVDLVNLGHNYIGDVVDSDLKKLVNAGALSATTDFSFVKEVDFIAICVPTPLDKHQQPDISYVRDSTKEVAKYLTKETMVVLESTTYPGTTEELIKPLLEEGTDFLKDAQWCILRGKDNTALVAKGGNNDEPHNHNDVGTFSLYVNTIPVFIDAGVGTYTKQTFGKDRYTIWTMQSNYHNLPMINGVPQKFGQQYKATNTVCNEKKRTFSADIATAYPAEAKVKSWIRSYALDDRKLMITDNYTLNEALTPNQLNFLTWGKVSFPSPGKVRVEVKGQKVELDYPSQFKAELETIKLDDPRLSNVWGKEIYRITLKTEEKKATGNYKFVIQQVK